MYFLFIGIELSKLIAYVKYSVLSLILVFFSVLTGVIKKLTFVIFFPISPYQLYYYLINLLLKRSQYHLSFQLNMNMGQAQGIVDPKIFENMS